jgi:hypothetical protein
MFKLLSYLIWFALGLGVAEVGVNAVMGMASKAAHAHQHDQLSYSKWNRMLWHREKP